MKLLKITSVTELVQQDNSRSGKIVVRHGDIVVLTKQWVSVAHRDRIIKEIQMVTRQVKTTVLKLVA